MYFYPAAFQAKGKNNPPRFNIMKAYVILKNSLLAAALGCALSSCYDPYYDSFSVSGSYSSGGSGMSYMYDNSGYPIYGYYGGRPIYAYDTFGSPIYSISLIRPNYYIPRGTGPLLPRALHPPTLLPPHGASADEAPVQAGSFPSGPPPGQQQAGSAARQAQPPPGLRKTRQFPPSSRK